MRRIMLLAAVLLGTACGERYEGITLSRVAGAEQADIDDDRISVPEGRVLVFEVRADAVDDHRDYDATDVIELSSVDPSVARVEMGVRVDSWVVFGTATGQTEVEVRINGELQDAISVVVEPPR